MAPTPITGTVEPRPSLATLTHVIYGLHAFSLVTGIVGAATIVGAFLTGWPSIIAVVLNYVKRGEARGTWLESHFRWQIRTFWYGLLWVALPAPDDLIELRALVQDPGPGLGGRVVGPDADRLARPDGHVDPGATRRAAGGTWRAAPGGAGRGGRGS